VVESIQQLRELAEKLGFVDYVLIGINVEDIKSTSYSIGELGMERFGLGNNRRIDRMLGAMQRLETDIISGVEENNSKIV